MPRNKKVLFLLGATTVVSFQYALYPLNAVTDYKKPLAPMFLTPPTRSEQIASLKSSKLDPFDALIIGGGATGAGCALDASLRGLKVALVEANDFSSGTSSKSTKLIHGGLRYLEKAVFSLDVQQLKMVYEGLSERRILLRQAPHLCSSLPTLLPCYAWWEVPLYYLGLKAYDMVALSGRGSIRGSSYLSSQETLRQFPPLLPSTAKNESLKGAIMYFDGHMDDARLNVSIILTAACNGAVTVNYNRVEKILLNDNGKACAVNIRDTLDGSEYTVYAKSIINAAGPFSDSVRMLECKTVKPRMVHSAGTHVTLPKFYAPKESGLIIPKTDDGRVFFLLPWKNYAIAGTTDNVVPLSESPQARDEDLDFIFSQMKKYLGFEVSKKDVKSAWCGIRPLVANSTAEESQNLVRDHTVTVSNGGVLSIVGGKWTTYRLMAKDAIDTLLTEVIPEAQKRALPCCTHQLVLHGSEYYSSALPAQLAKEKGIDYDVAEHLSETYGSQSWDVLSARQEEPAFLQKRIAPDLPILEAEVYYSALHEYTETIRDFLARRVRICFLDTEKALSCSRKVAEIMGEVKGWSVSKIEQEMKEFEDFLSKEFTVQT